MEGFISVVLDAVHPMFHQVEDLLCILPADGDGVPVLHAHKPLGDWLFLVEFLEGEDIIEGILLINDLHEGGLTITHIENPNIHTELLPIKVDRLIHETISEVTLQRFLHVVELREPERFVERPLRVDTRLIKVLLILLLRAIKKLATTHLVDNVLEGLIQAQTFPGKVDVLEVRGCKLDAEGVVD